MSIRKVPKSSSNKITCGISVALLFGHSAWAGTSATGSPYGHGQALSESLPSHLIERTAPDYTLPLVRHVLQKPFSELTTAEKTFIGGLLTNELTEDDQATVDNLVRQKGTKDIIEELREYAEMSFEIGK